MYCVGYTHFARVLVSVSCGNCVCVCVCECAYRFVLLCLYVCMFVCVKFMHVSWESLKIVHEQIVLYQKTLTYMYVRVGLMKIILLY